MSPHHTTPHHTTPHHANTASHATDHKVLLCGQRRSPRPHGPVNKRYPASCTFRQHKTKTQHDQSLNDDKGHSGPNKLCSTRRMPAPTASNPHLSCSPVAPTAPSVGCTPGFAAESGHGSGAPLAGVATRTHETATVTMARYTQVNRTTGTRAVSSTNTHQNPHNYTLF
jgi:hypothetical protein